MFTNDCPDTLCHNVETTLDDGELTTNKESNGDGRIKIPWSYFYVLFAINNQDLTSTDVASEASDSHHGQSKSQGHLFVKV